MNSYIILAARAPVSIWKSRTPECNFTPCSSAHPPRARQPHRPNHPSAQAVVLQSSTSLPFQAPPEISALSPSHSRKPSALTPSGRTPTAPPLPRSHPSNDCTLPTRSHDESSRRKQVPAPVANQPHSPSRRLGESVSNPSSPTESPTLPPPHGSRSPPPAQTHTSPHPSSAINTNARPSSRTSAHSPTASQCCHSAQPADTSCASTPSAQI